MRPAILLALVPAISMPLLAQGGDGLLEVLRKQPRPVLVALSKAADLPKARAAWSVLCGQEPLLEHAPFPLILNAELPGDLARGVIQGLRLPEGGWALLQGGKVLTTGSGMPEAQALADCLEQAGVKSLRRLLQDFLRRHPDHLEARSRSIGLLRTTAEERTRKALKLAIPREAERRRDGGEGRLPERAWKELLPPKERRLPDGEDVRIWAPLAQELDRLFSRGDWLRIELEGYDSLPVEACSPLMTNLYRRHRPLLLQALRETPGDPNVLGHWVWQSRVLGEPLLPTFESLRPPVKGDAWPGPTVLRALVEEAREAQDWSGTRRLLERMWRQATQASAWSDPSLAGRESAARTRELDWTALARPYLEACLKAGEAEAAATVLDAAARLPEREALLASAAALAEGQGRKALAQAWGAWAPPKQRPLPARLWREATLFAAGTSAPRRIKEYIRHDGLQQLLDMRLPGATGTLTRGNDPAWLAYLGWNAQEDRWQVLDRAGRILAEGVELPEAEGMVAVLRQAGHVTPESRIADFLQEQPGDAPALHERMILALRALVRGLPPEPESVGGEPAALEPRHQALLEAFLSASAEAREGGWWQRPGTFLRGWPHGQEDVLQLHLREEAARWLEVLEASLIQIPQGGHLWEAWGLWMAFAPDRPIQPFLDRLVLAPGSQPSTWPPHQAVEALKVQLQRKGAWTQLEALVRKPAEDTLQRAEKLKRERPGSSPWVDADGVLWLAGVLVKQGRGADADDLLRRWLALDVRPEMVHGMLDRAPLEGFPELAERWREKVPKLEPRRK